VLSSASAGACVPRVNILDVQVSAIDMAAALEAIEGWIHARRQHYVCVANVHVVMECRRDAGLRDMVNAAGLVTPDGMPLVWLSRMAGLSHVGRVYGPDLMLRLCERSLERGWRQFFYGSTGETLERLERRLRARFPGLCIAGALAPPFRALSADEDAAIVARINETGPDVVWVGLGCPKQERWMAEHLGRIAAPVMIGVGAAFDFHAGLKRQAPCWMQHAGLEWLFRLATEPRRLWYRYLVYNPLFVVGVARQAVSARSFFRPRS
jgi:N-acetylglucosaminyldiphosphoundecaprenol N-acetyl-beta-D-mannosaminyltransferase